MSSMPWTRVDYTRLARAWKATFQPQRLIVPPPGEGCKCSWAVRRSRAARTHPRRLCAGDGLLGADCATCRRRLTSFCPGVLAVRCPSLHALPRYLVPAADRHENDSVARCELVS